MCGITGFTWEDEGLLRRMTDVIAHRGPDDHGYYADSHVSLGHRRLSIIDLSSAGHQPMSDRSKSVVIVYNGEIYNFKELRQQLEKKYEFHSQTDTEVVINAYKEWGTACVTKFNGMFAFALWDVKKKKLFLARDRLGIKPLYYMLKEGRLIFASEIKSILEYDALEPELNKEALADYLVYQNVFDDKTFFKGVKMLSPGHHAVFDVSAKKLIVKRYWSPSFHYQKKEYGAFLDDFRAIQKQAVERHMISDVPVGIYLSGGFDSSSVAFQAANLSKERLSTFTGAFDEGADYDERKRSKIVAKAINAKTYERVISPEDFIRSIKDIVYHLDEPRVGMGAFPQYHVSGLVSKHVTVVLTGHGGDELFLGYAYHKAELLKKMMRKNPLSFFRIFENRSEILPLLYYTFGPIVKKELKWGLLVLFSKKELKDLLVPEMYAKMAGYDPDRFFKEGFGKMDGLERMQSLYLTAYLPSLFVVEDKVGMAHSIEARVPFCDNQLVDFALSVPPEMKMHDLELKSLVKDSLRGQLPRSYFEQKKMGFPTPLKAWFRGDLKEYAYDILLSDKLEKRRIFNKEYIRRLLDDHVSGRRDNSAKIWSLLNIELWFRIFIDGRHRSQR